MDNNDNSLSMTTAGGHLYYGRQFFYFYFYFNIANFY